VFRRPFRRKGGIALNQPLPGRLISAVAPPQKNGFRQAKRAWFPDFEQGWQEVVQTKCLSYRKAVFPFGAE